MPGSGLILGIESSCDETAAAVVERGACILSSVVASQIATHARYGGVVPELASREHLRAIVPVVRAALAQANVTLADLDAIAVTSGPGLAGALLVGITYAKALAFAQGLPLIAVNHLEGHIHAVLLHERESSASVFPQSCHPERAQRVEGPAVLSFSTPQMPVAPGPDSGTWDSTTLNSEPALALVVSGGHTHLYLCRPAHGSWTYTLVGRTLDDAAGEAYDKVAKLLGFGYPGGPWIDALAQFGNPLAVPFSFSQIKTKLHLAGKPPRTKAARTAPIAHLDPRFLFSFSGIKTAVLRYVELHSLRPETQARTARLFGPQNCHPERSAAESKDLHLVSGVPQMLGVPSFPQLFAERVGDHEPQSSPTPPKTKAEALVLCPQQTLDLVASFQHAVVGDLMKKTFAAAESLGARRILVTGGVAANRELRARFTAEAARRNLKVSFPTLALSTDNAAMIAAAAWPRLQSRDFASPSLSADPSLVLGQ
jgi:N6-L-threonylcarbamoyladenine synthase